MPKNKTNYITEIINKIKSDENSSQKIKMKNDETSSKI